jgi:two-component system chemotaxis sensor kinase CheA
VTSLADNQDLLQEFLTEAGELLDDVDVRLVELEHHPDDAELLNRVFRGFHTVKGGAGFLEATALVDLCHRAENLLDQLRGGTLALDAGLMDHILASTAEVRRMFGEMQSGQQPAAAPAELLEALTAAARGEKPAAASPVPKKAPEAPKPSPAVAAPAGDEPDWKRFYEALLPPAGASAPAAAGPAPARAAAARTASIAVKPDTTIRVDTGRFDQILNLSGEIGLTRNRLGYLRSLLIKGASTEDTLAALDLSVNRLGTLVTDLQTTVMKARMQPVGRVFQKYTRLARDLARQLGKEIELTLTGEDTEIDKTILEELNDPLVHLVRNAVDHGVETPAEREAAGKPRAGAIEIAARQEGDRIVIEIRDDGKGMSAERLRDKAVEKGVIDAAEAATLDERQSLNLIFLPGFSTKDEISDVSGRGVGMDVVRTNIQKLKGRIDLASVPGQGSRVTIVLPLTLAILPVLMLRSGEQPYAMPLSAVREVIAIDSATVQSVSGRPALAIRGDVLPLVPLSRLVGEGGPGAVGVVATIGDRTVVLQADQVIGQDEVMIKPLEGIKPRGIAGATLSSEGVLVLVLELHELLEAVPAGGG